MRLPILTALAGFVAVGLIVFAYVFYGSPASQGSEHVPVVIVIRNPPALDPAWASFQARMEELGYRDGENIRYVVTDVSTNLDSTKQRIELLLQEQPDLVYAMGVLATRAAKQVADEAGSHIPIVFAVVSDPVGSGFVATTQHPGGNITGVTPASNLTASKRLELLHEMLPSVKRVIHPWNDEHTSGVVALRELAPTLNLSLVEQNVADVAELVQFLGTFPFKPGDAIMRPSDAIGAGAFVDTVALSREKKVPLVGTNEGDTKGGALMSYGANYADAGIAAARMVGEILQGGLPADIPVEELSKFYLSVNLDTAREIGVSISDEFLLKTHQIIDSS